MTEINKELKSGIDTAEGQISELNYLFEEISHKISERNQVVEYIK